MAPASAPLSWNLRLDDCVARLRSSEGIEIIEAKIGKPCSPAVLARANTLVAGGLGKTLSALYADVDGFCIRWTGNGQAGEIGVLPVAQLVGKGSLTAFEDAIWNEFFEEHSDGQLAKVQQYRLLWQDGLGQATCVSLAFTRGKPTMLYGETNSPEPLSLTVEEYLEALLACGGLEFETCFVGKQSQRKAACADLARAMDDSLATWERPAFLPRKPRTSAKLLVRPGAAKVAVKARAPINRDAFPPVGEPPFVFLEQEGAAPERVAFSTDGHAVVGLGHGHLHVADLGKRKIRWSIAVGARSFAIAPDGETIAVAESRSARLQRGECLFLRRLSDGEKITKKAWTAAGFTSLDQLTFRTDGRELAIEAGGNLQLLDPSGFAVTRSGPRTGALGKLEYAPGKEDRILALNARHDNEPAFRVHDLSSGELIFEKLGACAFAMSPDGAMIAIGVGTGRWVGSKFIHVPSPVCEIIDAETGKRVHAIAGTIRSVENLHQAVAFSPDGSVIAFAESGHETLATIRIFDTKTWKLVGEIAVGGDRFSDSPITVFDLAISRDRLLAAATHANGIRVWRL